MHTEGRESELLIALAQTRNELAREKERIATALRERDEAVAEADKQRARRNLCQTDRNTYELQNEELRKALAAANARADAANSKLAATDVERLQALSALAAARQECDLWKQIAGDLYAPLEERGFKCEPRMDGSHISVCGTFDSDNCPLCMCAAPAAPGAAAGEDSK